MSSLTCSQIRLTFLVVDGRPTDLTKLKKKTLIVTFVNILVELILPQLLNVYQHLMLKIQHHVMKQKVKLSTKLKA